MERFDAAQIEQLKEIGTYLRQIREERSVSLDEISAKTYVPMRMLRALEQAQVDILPEPVFVRGFIRRYAEALGLDGLGIAKAFPLQPTPAPPSIPLPEASPMPQATSSPTSGVEQIRFARSSREGRRSLSLTPLFLVIGAIAIGGVAYAVITHSTGSRPSTSQTTASPSPVPSPAVTPTPSPTPSPAASASPTPTVAPSPTPSPVATGPVTVDLRFSGASWVRVRVDGQVAYEGTLPQGTERRWAGQREVVVRAGNAGAVSVAFNQGTAQPMGAPGQVANQTFTAEATSATPAP